MTNEEFKLSLGLLGFIGSTYDTKKTLDRTLLASYQYKMGGYSLNIFEYDTGSILVVLRHGYTILLNLKTENINHWRGNLLKKVTHEMDMYDERRKQSTK